MKTMKILTAAILTLMFTSCDTTIPEVDTTSPNFNFRITGDGFERDFTHEDDFSAFQLNLRANTSYDFIYTAGDSGGLQLAQWQLPQDEYIRLTSNVSSPWSIRDLSFLSRMITWTGNRSNPITGTILNGSFTTEEVDENNSTFITFRFFTRDYGGRSGTPNSVSKELNIKLGHGETEVVLF